jgi:hypothetical protein
MTTGGGEVARIPALGERKVPQQLRREQLLY